LLIQIKNLAANLLTQKITLKGWPHKLEQPLVLPFASRFALRGTMRLLIGI
jgi:hypothetical protein